MLNFKIIFEVEDFYLIFFLEPGISAVWRSKSFERNNYWSQFKLRSGCVHAFAVLSRLTFIQGKNIMGKFSSLIIFDFFFQYLADFTQCFPAEKVYFQFIKKEHFINVIVLILSHSLWHGTTLKHTWDSRALWGRF